MRRLRPILLCTSVFLSLMVSIDCTRNTAGATTETTNGVVGAAIHRNGEPAPNAIVKLFPGDYDPVADRILGADFIDTADAKGNYRFSRIEPGRYTVLARDKNSAMCFLIEDIAVVGDSVTAIPAAILDKSGSIAADFSSSGLAAGGYVYIPGTDIFSLIGSDGSALLAGVPSGKISTVMLALGDKEKRNVLRRDGITVEPGDTATIELPLWKYYRRLALNTTPAGADISGNVYCFALLVRLNSGNFDFSQARSDGADLVFTGKGINMLPREIERWDAAAQRAEVWVKVDTVYGNDSTQSITMFWGNPDASLRSDAGAVFDTTCGFEGVWHMGSTASDSVRDATVNRYHGVSPDNARPKVAEGVIGNCRVFDGAADYIVMPNTADSRLNFDQNGFYSVSAWVFLDASDNASRLIVSKGYEQYYLRCTSLRSSSPLWEFVEFNENTKWQTSTYPATSRQWTFLTGVRQGTRQFLYCNGVLVDSTLEIWQNTVSRNTSNDLSIGKFLKAVTVPINDGYGFFKGSIDEVRIISAAKSSDWVRLCYMNQRTDDRLVVHKK